MTLQDRLVTVREALEAHNSTSTKPIDIDGFFKKLDEMGGTSEEALAEATWEDLESCGLPRILARRIAGIFRGPQPTQPATPQTVVVMDDDPDKRARAMTPKQLIEAYDPKQSKNPVALRLKELSEDRHFIVFEDETTEKIDTETSLNLFDQLDDHGEKRTVFVKKIPHRVYKVGARPLRTADEHPLYPDTALRPDGTSEVDLDWGSVPLKIRQIYRLAIDGGELNMSEYREADIYTEATTRDEEAICRLYRKAAVKWRELSATGQLPTLKVMMGKKKADDRSNDPFGVNRTV